MKNAYDVDVVAWSVEQAKLLRARRWSELDIDNLAEEIEDVGRSEQHDLQRRLAALISHLLKWRHQPERRCASWRASMEVQRRNITRLLEDAPSLRQSIADPDWLQGAWDDGLVKIIDETGLHDLPYDALWTAGQILDQKFFPD